MAQTPPLTNCHTHIFTSDHVPPFLGKTFLPFGLWYILRIPFIVGIFKFWFNGPYKWQFKSWYKKIARGYYFLRMFIARNILFNITSYFVGAILTINTFYILYDWIMLLASSTPSDENTVEWIRNILTELKLLLIKPEFEVKILFILFVLLFVKWGRNLIFFLLKRFFKFFTVLPGKETKKYLGRYLNIGRFAFYEEQKNIFKQLEEQYPNDTRFVILSMDMEYMDAGKPKVEYQKQLQDLMDIKIIKKDTFHPFLFIDPRRIAADPNFLKYAVDKDGKVILEDCTIKKYMEAAEQSFSGFKIYPALGYYPFDEALLPIWKYAVQRKLPIMTHCIRGTIFYRGPKKKEWDSHPIFKENDSSDDFLLLPETKNSKYSINFTHPLNYLCLLEEFFLRKIVANAKDPRIKVMFGFSSNEKKLVRDLNELKICFGHYGGEDQWTKYFESDRDQYSPALTKDPYGINFMVNSHGHFSYSKLAQLWRNTDWYSIISSLMLQHPNVYSDISYILHDPGIWSLLKDSLDRPPIPTGARQLSEAILFGTDFYVVRNHKSERQLWAETEYNLSMSDVIKIANVNPANYLFN